MSAPALLTVRGLSIAAGVGRARRTVTAGTDLELARGEAIAIVGESGSGKTLTAKAIARLLPRNVAATGLIRFDGLDLLALTERDLRAVRGRRISMLFQDPFTMLNPLMRAAGHIDEMLAGQHATRAARSDEVRRRLTEVGVTGEGVLLRLPFQLSGGMCQRVALAAALARDPELLIADEPSSALDATTQAEVMALLKRIQVERGMGLILITHDLRLAFAVCERVYVLYAGSVLEVGDARRLERHPLHPYTLGLLLSETPAGWRVPSLAAIPGSVPRCDEVADRCAFADRCEWSAEVCRTRKPRLAEIGHGRRSACVRWREIGPSMRARRRRSRAPGPDPDRSRAPERPLISVRDLAKTFVSRGGRMVPALKGVSIEIASGESVGLVGESGSGKTTVARCLVGLETPTRGTIEIAGRQAGDYAVISRDDRAQLRRTMQMVFQDPYSALNPRHSVRFCLAEALRAAGVARRGWDRRIVALLRDVGLPEAYADRRPASLSGGERQRVAIARALAVGPSILICDEPVSALDVSVRAQILNLLRRLQAEHGLSCLFITHDLAAVRQVADRIYVLHRGEIVEHGSAAEVLGHPRHPYTRQLVGSVLGRGEATEDTIA